MASSSASSNGNSQLDYGTVTPPVITGEEQDNDSYIVTDDGTSTGTPLEMWKFDEETGTWMTMPLGGGVSCQVETTRVAIRALRTAGNLVKDCHYVLTDYNRGTVGTAKILLHAIDENTLSMTAMVKTTFDTLAWNGIYDIDTNRIERLQDNIGNDVRGGASVDVFPWGVAAVSENQVYDARLNYTAGTVSENTLDSGVTLTVVSGNVNNNHMKSLSNVTVNAGTFTDNTVGEDANVTINSGSNYENRIGTSCNYNQVGTGYIRYSSIDGNGSFTNGNVNINNSSFINAAAINTTGSTGIITNSTLGYVNAGGLQNISSLTITQSNFSAGVQIAASNATRLYLYRSNFTGGARILVTAAATLNCSYASMDSYAYIQILAGDSTINYTKLSALSYIRSDNGTNRWDRCIVSAQSNIRCLGTTTGARYYYCESTSGGTQYQTNCTNCYNYYTRATSQSQIRVEDRTDARIYYSTAQDASFIRAYGTGAGQNIIYYCTASARGYLDQIDCAALHRYYSCHVSAQSILRSTAVAAATNVYYSSFTAYYYLLLDATSTGTRYGLHGYGRQSFTGWPTTNGTPLRNWP